MNIFESFHQIDGNILFVTLLQELEDNNIMMIIVYLLGNFRKGVMRSKVVLHIEDKRISDIKESIKRQVSSVC